MIPEIVELQAPPEPKGGIVERTLNALVNERRMPYQLSRQVDKVLKALRFEHKTVHAAGFDVRIRRLSSHEVVVAEVLEGDEYKVPGYEVRPKDVVLDVGGNIGTFAMRSARSAFSGRVVSVEPVRENYFLLVENIGLNALTNVVPLNAAVVGEKKRVRIYTKELANASIRDLDVQDPGQYEEVQGLTLPDIFSQMGLMRVDLLKLDCEGAEYEILERLPPEYFARIARLVMEYHGTTQETRRAEAATLIQRLEDMGFVIDRYTEYRGYRTGHIFARNLILEPSPPPR